MERYTKPPLTYQQQVEHAITASDYVIIPYH